MAYNGWTPVIIEDEEPVLEGFELVAYVASDEARHILAELALADEFEMAA